MSGCTRLGIDISPFDTPLRVSLDCYSPTCNYVITYTKFTPVDDKGVFTILIENTGDSCSTVTVTATYSVENGVYKFTHTDTICGGAFHSGREIVVTPSSGGVVLNTTNETFTKMNVRITPPIYTAISVTGNIQLYLRTGFLTNEVLEVIYAVRPLDIRDLSLGKYCGTVCSGRIQVLFLTINEVVRGKGSLLEKTSRLGVSAFLLTYYVLVKVLMGLLIFGEMNIKWALRCNYNELIEGVEGSCYDDVLPWLKERRCMEKYLR